MSFKGTPCFSFYRPRESTGYNGRKEKNERERKSFRVAGPFLSFVQAPLTWPVVTGTAPRRTHVLLMMSCPGVVSVLISGRTWSRQHSDQASVTVDDMSPLE